MIALEAHRGVSSRYPENTMSAFRAAAREGYGMIELDPKYTKDGTFIILHDRTVNRTTRTAEGDVIPQPLAAADCTLNDLRRLDAGIAFSPAFAGERIPTLGEVLTFAAETGIPLKFDNVLYSFPAPLRQAFYAEVARAVTAYGASSTDLYGFTCAGMDHIREVRAALPQAPIHYDGPVTDEAGNVIEDVLQSLSSLVPAEKLTVWLPIRRMSWLPYPPATPEVVAAVKRVGACGIWILKDAADLPHALSLGADWLETTGAVTPDMLN